MEGNFQTKVDELQRQLSGAEDEKKTLNQVSFQSTLFLCFKWDQLYWESCGPQHQTPLFSAATNGNPPKAGAHPEIGRHRDDRPAASKRNQQPTMPKAWSFLSPSSSPSSTSLSLPSPPSPSSAPPQSSSSPSSSERSPSRWAENFWLQ